MLESTVVVMEDSKDVQNVIREVIEDKLNWNLKIVSNKEEAVEILEQKQVGFFILDNWVGNKQEGLDALEQIREVDPTVFVAIFSHYERFKNQAYKLGCNLFVEKSPDIRDGINYIATEMLKYRLEVLEVFKKKTDEQLLSLNTSESNEERNITKYQKLKSDSNWLKENQGKFVALVDGECVKSSDNETDESGIDLLNWLISADKYRDKQRFFAKVEKELETIDEPSSLWFD
ncbi:hypothetical protein BV378_37635 [Nostoc sp. RF31YmG]|nr:hypothetical protein BV378_37635 [Nostoc sp. RF31YmG]OUL18179.1 hypothetical protein BV375_33930 [Nostoc sp. 106C]